MTRPARVLVLTGNGINCEMETAHACRLAGADTVDIRYLWDLGSGATRLTGYDLVCLPGGFLDGDDLGSARAGAIRFKYMRVAGREERMIDQFRAFVADGGLMIGICNGFQLMVKLGLLPNLAGTLTNQEITLTNNDSGRFEDRWVTLRADPASPCVFTRGLGTIELPVRHGEGKLLWKDDVVGARLAQDHLVPLRYIDPESGEPTTTYPLNPNGSADGIAALADPTGRLFGMMPHPEAYLHRTNHPAWTRRVDAPEAGDGLAIFVNAIRFLHEER